MNLIVDNIRLLSTILNFNTLMNFCSHIGIEVYIKTFCDFKTNEQTIRYDLGRICPDHQQGTADPPDGAVEHPGTHSAQLCAALSARSERMGMEKGGLWTLSAIPPLNLKLFPSKAAKSRSPMRLRIRTVWMRSRSCCKPPSCARQGTPLPDILVFLECVR